MPLTVLLVVGALLVPAAMGAVEKGVKGLSESQKAELEALYSQLSEIYKKIAGKKAEFGLISPEESQRIAQGIDRHFAGLKQEGFSEMMGDDDHCSMMSSEGPEGMMGGSGSMMGGMMGGDGMMGGSRIQAEDQK